MLKKNYQFQKQLILKYNYKQDFFWNLLVRSIAMNHYIEPITRISYLATNWTNTDRYRRFATYQKLQCLTTLSFKVPNKSFAFSRFFLNKQLDKLVFANTLK